MNLGEFKTQISANIRRGSAVDTLIPAFIRNAVLWIERNKTLQYMRKFAVISVSPEDEEPRYISLGVANIKTVEFLRWSLATGEYAYLSLRNPRDFPIIEVGTPTGYWLDGVSNIVLSATPGEALLGELQVARYTAWPTQDASTHWLLDFATDILEAQTMINFAKHARDTELLGFWAAIRDQALPGLYAADEEFQYANTDLAMEYNGN